MWRNGRGGPKKRKRAIVSIKEKGRTWYSPEAWQYRGLRLKEEVKDEEETLGLEDAREDVAKRVGRGGSRTGSEGPSSKRARLAGE